MPASHTAVPMPCDPVSPSNPIIIQCRINPTQFYDKIEHADYLAPPATLVFAKRDGEKTSGINSKHTSMKRKRGGDVHDIITNMYNINEPDRIPKNALRCIGVTYDGVLDAKGAKNHPDKVGRLAVIVSGAVTIVCNKDDLAGLSVGDMLEWRMEDNKQIYNGLNPKWSTARIGKASMGGGIGSASIDMPYEGLFPYLHYDDSNLTDVKKRMAVVQHFNMSSPMEQGFVEGINPYHAAKVLAHIKFASLGIKLDNEDDWVDKLYDPESKWYIMEAKPEPNSIKWLQHCLGDVVEADKWLDITNDSTAKTTVCAGGKDDNETHVPQQVGWWKTTEINRQMGLEAGATAILKRIKFMTSVPTQNTDDYFLYKAVNGIEFTSSDVVFMTNGKKIEIASIPTVAEFIAPFFENGRTHSAMSIMAFYRSGITKNVGAANNPLFSIVDENRRNLLSVTKINVNFFNVGVTNGAIDTTKALDVITETEKTAAANNALTIEEDYARDALLEGLKHKGSSSSHVFGMLLEKSQHANEARVLLCPGACM